MSRAAENKISTLKALRHNDVYSILSRLIASDDDSDKAIANSGVTRSDQHAVAFLIAWSVIAEKNKQAIVDAMTKNEPDGPAVRKLTVKELNHLINDAEVDWKSILTEKSEAQSFELAMTIKCQNPGKMKNSVEGIKEGLASAAAQTNVFHYSKISPLENEGITISTVVTQKAKWLKPFEEVAIRFDDQDKKAEAVQFWQVPEFDATCPAELKPLQATLKDKLDQLNAKIKEYNASAEELNAVLQKKLGGVKQLDEFFDKMDTIDHDSYFTRSEPWTDISLSQQSVDEYFNEIIQKLEQEKKLDDAIREKIREQQKCRLGIIEDNKQLKAAREQAKCFDNTGHFLFYPGEKKSGSVDELYLIAPEGDSKQFDIDTKVYLNPSIYRHFTGKSILDQITVENVSVLLKTKAQVDKEGASVVQGQLIGMVSFPGIPPGFRQLKKIAPTPTQIYSFSCVFRYNDAAIQAVFLDGSKPLTYLSAAQITLIQNLLPPSNLKTKFEKIQIDKIPDNRCSIHLNDDEIKTLVNCLEDEAKKGNVDINHIIKLMKRFNPSVFDATKRKADFTVENGIQLRTADSRQCIFLQPCGILPSKVLQQSLENDTRKPSLQEQLASHSLPADEIALHNLLKSAGLLSEKNTEIINELSSRGLKIVDVLEQLKRFNLLSKETFDLIVSEETVNAMSKSNDPVNLATALSILHQAHLLTEDNKKALAQHTNISQLMSSLNKLKKNNLLNQQNFISAFRPPYQTKDYSVIVKKHFTHKADAQSWAAVIEREKLKAPNEAAGQKSEKEILFRYRVSKAQRWKTEKMIAQTDLASRHPNHVMPFLSVKHRDGTVDVDTEFADAGSLLIYVQTFSSEDRLSAATSIARQLVVSLMYFDMVHDHLHHRDISLRTIFLRKDGCVKLGFFDLIGPQDPQNEKYQDLEAAKQKHMTDNADWYFGNPYVAPERQGDAQNEKVMKDRINSDEKADVWAVGTTIISVLLGKTLLPKVKMKKDGEDNASEPTPGQRRAFENEKKWFGIIQEAMEKPTYMEKLNEELEKATNEKDEPLRVLLTSFIDHLKNSAELAHFLHRCLQSNPEKRASLAELKNDGKLAPFFGNAHSAKELADWKEARKVREGVTKKEEEKKEDKDKRVATDKKMRDEVKVQQKTAWEELKKAIIKVRKAADARLMNAVANTSTTHIDHPISAVS